jgi:hypothetical protein
MCGGLASPHLLAFEAPGVLAWPAAGVYCIRFGGRREGTGPFRHPIGIGYPECIFGIHIRPSAFK